RRTPARPLQAREKAGQRCPQVMRDILGHTFDLVHQPLDLVEHAVDDEDQWGEITTGPAARQPLTEIAIDDALDRARDGIDPADGARADGRCTGQAYDEDQSGARG